ncbi:protein FAR1-RELATED SEQUENCE 5-like [Salvia splendens]|uniref:protein FAR1-RELATED SEQUENCE 5-like n=1 Tax=Salvia splendens TaxID=180675 RepID=UPI001C25AEA5|nr:protein FAR1-RELATED SEQUENCE 5-like [Salvia splendens]
MKMKTMLRIVGFHNGCPEYVAAIVWNGRLNCHCSTIITETHLTCGPSNQAVWQVRVVVVPECSPDLKPVVGQKFQSLEFAFACYEVYARAVGFDTRKQAMRKVDDVTTWYRVVCNREGRKKGDEDDQLNARSGFTIKRRKLSKRCGCTASISFRYFSKDCLSGYIIEEFNEIHNHHMVETEHQQFMSSNRKLDDVHHKFILDCSKANIGLTLTFKLLKEILGGFDLVGCTVGDIRNVSRDIKAYAQGFDVQMVLDDMAKKKDMSEAFTYHYEVNEFDQLVALFWCDGLMKQNYHMFGDIVSFDSTYNTNRLKLTNVLVTL